MAFHNELGKIGEELAVNHLQQKGYEILETNWRYLKAEIDIIAQRGNTLAIVEVKTRSSDVISTPEDAVNPKKIKLLVSAANEYVIQNDLDVDVRFDIIAILKNKNAFSITHIEEAFLFF
jgi:putative endonuclease